MWNTLIKQFEHYLQLERVLSSNSVEAYVADIRKLVNYQQVIKQEKQAKQATQSK